MSGTGPSMRRMLCGKLCRRLLCHCCKDYDYGMSLVKIKHCNINAHAPRLRHRRMFATKLDRNVSHTFSLSHTHTHTAHTYLART